MSSSARLRRALLVVDMTVEQLDDIPLSERQRLLHAVSTLITSLDWDWIVDARLWIETHQTTSLAWLYPNVGIANTSGAELHESVRSLLNDKELTHIAKTHYSAFFENDLDEQLRARGIDDVYICGIHTNYCVASTAMASFERRYHTFVVGDACASAGGDEAHNVGLACVERYVGSGAVVTLQNLL